jgi:DNA-binding CsgD family transcriptional regulator
MAAKTAEKFSSYLLTSERELAQEVTTSLLTKGSVVINIFFLSQLLFLTGKVTQNHAIATIFIISSLLLSIRLMKKFQSNNPIIINQICLLMLPIYIDNSITKPWVSYGLLCAIFVLLAACLDNRPLFITALLVTPFLQFFVANLNLLGVIDSQDLLFLNSYFSTLCIPVLVISALNNFESVRSAFAMGAKGFVSKEAPIDEIAKAISTVVAGNEWVNSNLAKALGSSNSPTEALSNQERKALILYASGLKLEVVARRMEVAPSTVKQYIDRAKAKYRLAGINVRTKIEIYKLLRDEGLVN